MSLGTLVSTIARWVRSDIFTLLFRQIFVALAFFLSSLLLLRNVNGDVYISFIDAQNFSYMVVAAVVGGLQPSLMFFIARDKRSLKSVLRKSIAVVCIAIFPICVLAYFFEESILDKVAIFLLCISVLLSSTFPFIILALDRVKLFSALEVIPNFTFLALAALSDNNSSASELILFFSVGHLAKSVLCILFIISHAGMSDAHPLGSRTFLHYFGAAGVIGFGHSAVQRIPPLIISEMFPEALKPAVLAAWTLLDRAQTIQQSLNLWIFKKNAAQQMPTTTIVKIGTATVLIAFALPLSLAVVYHNATFFGIRSEYHGVSSAMLAMAPAFMFATLRGSLQALAMSAGNSRLVMLNVFCTLGIMTVPVVYGERDPLSISLWLTAALAFSALFYVVHLRFRGN